MWRYKILFLLLILLGSCADNEDYSFQRVEHSEHELVSTNVPLYDPYRIVFLGDAVLVLDVKADHFIHAFSGRDLSPLGSFIRKGHGPTEETSIWEIRAMDENQFLVSTGNDIRMMHFDLETKSVDRIESYPAENLKGVFKLEQTLFGFPDYEELSDREFMGYDIIGEKYFPFGPGFLSQLNNYTLSEQRYFSAKNVTVHPDKHLFAAVYHLFPVLRIYHSTAGDLKREVSLKTNQPFPDALLDPNISLKQTKERVWENYVEIHSTASYIYASYVGKPLIELYPNDIIVPGDYPAEIHVWDWDGNPVKQIQLDHPIYSFTVSPDDKYLLATSVEMEEHLMKFAL